MILIQCSYLVLVLFDIVHLILLSILRFIRSIKSEVLQIKNVGATLNNNKQ